MIISLVIPTYNREDLVGEAIASALSQTGVKLEIIVVDDGSTDATAARVRRLSDPRLRYVRQDNRGRSVARNHGLALAQGELVSFLDSDDRLLPGALAAHAAVFAQLPELGMTVGGYREVDATGRPIRERRPWLSGGTLDLAGWLFDCYGMPGSVLHRRDWLERIGGFDQACEIAEDWDLYLRMAAAQCPMAWVAADVCVYRRHAGNSIGDVGSHRRGALATLAKLGQSQGVDGALIVRARAWTELVAARRAQEAGAFEEAVAGLTRAVALDPVPMGRRRPDVLEFWLSALAPDATPRQEADFIRPLIVVLSPTAREIRWARSRVNMAQFFAASSASDGLRGLGHGLRGALQDPSWLRNRGVWAAAVRSLRRATQALVARMNVGT